MRYLGLGVQEGHLSIPDMGTPGHTSLGYSHLEKLKTGETLGESTRQGQMRLKIMAGLVQYSRGESENYFLTVEGNKILNF